MTDEPNRDDDYEERVQQPEEDANIVERLARLHHTADELRYVAKLIDALNEDHDSIGVDPEGRIDVYWADVKMGTVMVPDGCGQFSYFPVAEKRL